MSKSTKMTQEAIASIVNKSKSLYCEECCTTFKMDNNGEWKKQERKWLDGDLAPMDTADLVADSFLMCTCGKALATKITEQVVIGEFVALN